MATTLTLTATDDVLLQNTEGNNVVLEGNTVDFYWSAGHRLKWLSYSQGYPGTYSAFVDAFVGGTYVYIKLYGSTRIPLYYYPGSVPVWVSGTNYNVGNIVIGDGSGLGYENTYVCISAHTAQASDRPITGAYYFYRWTIDNNNAQDTKERFFLINEGV